VTTQSAIVIVAAMILFVVFFGIMTGEFSEIVRAWRMRK
jgi:hypothetical protein